MLEGQKSQDGGQRSDGPAEGAAQPEQNSNAVAETTTTTTVRSSAEKVMDHLDIPEAVREQIRPKGENQKSEDGGQKSEDQDQGPAAAENADREMRNAESGEDDESEHEESEDEQEHEAEQEGEEPPRAVRKLQKRNQRLTKKLRDAERELEQFRSAQEAALEQGAQQAQRQVTAAPKGDGPLGKARTEAELDEMIAVAKATRELVRKNPEGVQVGDGENAKFFTPEDLREWAAGSEDVLFGAESRRRELREFKAQREAHDRAAREDFPALFEPDSKDRQAAIFLANKFPFIRDLPDANYALGLLLEGIRAVDARKKDGGRRSEVRGQNGTQKRAIDERAFAPRVPLAPHTSGPSGGGSSRNGNGTSTSTTKNLKQATESLLADADGSASSLAEVFAAMEKTGGSRRDARAPVAA